jgi:hypothetical protein
MVRLLLVLLCLLGPLAGPLEAQELPLPQKKYELPAEQRTGTISEVFLVMGIPRRSEHFLVCHLCVADELSAYGIRRGDFRRPRGNIERRFW